MRDEIVEASGRAKKPERILSRTLLTEDIAGGRPLCGPKPCSHPLSAGAERLSAHRPCQGHLSSTFGTAEKFGGICNLRMDDTNPTKEDVEYVDAIKEDIALAGLLTGTDRLYYASDYFEKMYECAVQLIEKGLGLCVRADARANAGKPRRMLTHPGGKPLSRAVRLRKAWTCFRA